jgi:uncharacterized radical SAM superfamily protein
VAKQPFHVFLIKPTRYDDEGYPIQWWRSIVPSNTLACVAALVEDAKSRDAAGPDAEIVLHTIDEMNAEVSTGEIVACFRTPGQRAMVMLAGVQTNQYPRAMDIARPLRAAGVPVCMGGFHVSGCVSMLGAEAEELSIARSLGVSLFAGEAEEGRIDEVLRDGFSNSLKPLYNYLGDTPSLEGAPTPILPLEVLNRSMRWSSIDLGRGCPFECSFCTIINVQGRRSRFRTVSDLERVVRENQALGIRHLFVTDDNLARNRAWETYASRLIQLQETDNIHLRFIVQVDALAHRVPGFVDKMYQAGAHVIFIGLESINPDNLESVNKRQNRIEEYREMLLAWKRHGCVTVCGYIVGFPHDTKESILRDIDIIKRELPIDLLFLNYLTPLPGSEDHKKMHTAGAWMDPDFNKYDLNHRVTQHAQMSGQEWEEAYREAHRRFYSFEHMERIFNRMMQMRTNQPFTTLANLLVYRMGPALERVAFSEFGILRVVRRKQRRHGMPLENPRLFYPRIAARTFSRFWQYVYVYARMRVSLARARGQHRRGKPYVDAAIAPLTGVEPLIAETEARSTPAARRRIEKREQAMGDIGSG